MVDRLTQKEIEEKIAAFFGSQRSHQVVTVNPEIFLSAQEDADFRSVIFESDLRVCDGFGLFALSAGRVRHRMTGSAVVRILCSHAKTVVLLGGTQGQAQRACEQLRQSYPHVQFVAIDPGVIHRVGKSKWEQPNALLGDIAQHTPDVLLVALGHGKQEFWIKEHLESLPSVRVAVGVGGVFAFLSGDITRAPRWMRTLGLEWMWRLYKEPRRIRRIYRAVIVFPIVALWDRIRGV